MRIGIDGSCLANRRGFGRFARQMLGALAVAGSRHEFAVFVDRPSLASIAIPAGFEAVVVEVREAPSRAARASGSRRLGDMLSMGRAVARAGLDLFYFPASYTFFPVWNCPRRVVTLHDTLALSRPDLVFPTRRGRIAWAIKEHAAVRWADRVVTVSEASRRDLTAWFRLEEGRVRVVGEGAASVFRPVEPDERSDQILGRYGVEARSPYLLYVGGLSPHKNLPRLVEAFASSVPSPVRLVLVGDLGDVFHTHVPELRAAIARHELGDRVLLTGFVPDEDLAHLYGRALALVQPSILEGFGLPPVEAMACGTPVLHSTAGSLPEVVGDAGIGFDPADVGAIGAALARVCGDQVLRSSLAARAVRRAGEHTWAGAARSLLAVFDELGPAGHGGVAA